MLFRKKIERACIYCQFGTTLDDNQILCSKKRIAQLRKSMPQIPV